MIGPPSSLGVLGWLFSSRPISMSAVPFVADDFTTKFFLISALFAIALGLRQTMGESIRGTYPFLFHRPIGRRWLLATKLAVGAAVYLICSAVPILVYGWWAATPGSHASPFEWAMTLPAWAGWLAMTLLYLGAFLTVLRPGRWYASKVLPLAAAAFATFVLAGLSYQFDRALWPFPIVLAVDGWLVAMIFFSARVRDYP